MGTKTAALTGAACALILALGAPTAVSAATEIVIGDSLGVGLAEVSHLQNFARISVHIRGPKALDQIRRAPAGATAFVVLGTNDANGSIAHLDKSIEDILTAAEKKHMRLVWIGPPCVHQSWDTRAIALDKMLAEKLPPRGVTYVPMRDRAFCTGGLHDRDGVHLKTKGYVYMWDKARQAAASGVPAGGDLTGSVAVAQATERPATQVEVAQAAERPAARVEATQAVARPATRIAGLAQTPARSAKFELAAGPAANSGGRGADEPKIYGLRVKRGGSTAQVN
jgi:hypothetical protein